MNPGKITKSLILKCPRRITWEHTVLFSNTFLQQKCQFRNFWSQLFIPASTDYFNLIEQFTDLQILFLKFPSSPHIRVSRAPHQNFYTLKPKCRLALLHKQVKAATLKTKISLNCIKTTPLQSPKSERNV